MLSRKSRCLFACYRCILRNSIISKLHLCDIVSVHFELDLALDICIQDLYFTCGYLSLYKYSD